MASPPRRGRPRIRGLDVPDLDMEFRGGLVIEKVGDRALRPLGDLDRPTAGRAHRRAGVPRRQARTRRRAHTGTGPRAAAPPNDKPDPATGGTAVDLASHLPGDHEKRRSGAPATRSRAAAAQVRS
ncbi:hypothetical protein TPA0908_39550 [Micromonospora sp. AKA38]|nr:hypothetical protein TPA0908_39550 [Micromonospora sp. AKA38]